MSESVVNPVVTNNLKPIVATNHCMNNSNGFQPNSFVTHLLIECNCLNSIEWRNGVSESKSDSIAKQSIKSQFIAIETSDTSELKLSFISNTSNTFF